MKENLVLKAYEIAKERYAAIGVNTDEVLDKLQKVQISLHCWQTDDVVGFESGSALSGGIQTIPVRLVISMKYVPTLLRLCH